MKLLYITNGINGSGGLERVFLVRTSFVVERVRVRVQNFKCKSFESQTIDSGEENINKI